MKIEKNKTDAVWAAVEVGLIFAWLTNLMGTDSFHNVYILCAVLGVMCLADNVQQGRRGKVAPRVGMALLAAGFSAATVVANYPLFQPVLALTNLFKAGCALLGGFVLGYHVLLCGVNRLPVRGDATASTTKRNHPVRFFLICFGAIGGFFLLYLFCVGYPGYLSTDSLNSLDQIRTGVFQNNNPFWYTKFIEVWIRLGMAVFGEINAAVAVYSSAQILIMAACFAYGLVTLYQAGIPGGCIGFAFFVYTFLPYNITYSITMWKDILFSGSALLIVASLYRLLKGIGASRMLNYVVFTLGSVGFCLMRTNGWYAYMVTAVIMGVLFFREHRKLLLLMVIILIICWILINPVLAALGVGETDFVETLAVPFQQIARVVAQGCELSGEEREFLSEMFWLDRVEALYSPEIVDPIKFEAMRPEGREFLAAHFGDFVKTWLSIGARYPGVYLEAWVELTKGFWNGGYYFWIYLAWTYPETSGIGGFEMDNWGKDLFDALFRYLEKPVILEPFYSIGLHIWLVVVCCFVCAAKKRRELLLTIPLLVLLVGLWIGTPVYAEYRYAYPVFTTFPVILFATVFSGGEKKAGYLSEKREGGTV